MQDNAILQRTLHKYEATLSDMDNALMQNGTSNDYLVQDMKKIVDKQLKEIVSL